MLRLLRTPEIRCDTSQPWRQVPAARRKPRSPGRRPPTLAAHRPPLCVPREAPSPPQHGQDVRHAPHSLQEAVQPVRLLLQKPHSLYFYAQDGSHLVL